MNSSAFISAIEASNLLNSDNVVFMDATYGQPIEYTIPDAVHFDIDIIADPASPMPHMIPTAEDFSAKIGAMGIDNETHIIVFDKSGFWMAASRVWWMFRVFGHNNISILNGGLPSWDGELAPYSPQAIIKKEFTAVFQPSLYADYNNIGHVKNDEEYLIVDARPNQAFAAGHIDESISSPLPNIINPNGQIKPTDELQNILASALNTNKKIITSCGSGVTACALAAAFYECGERDVAVYDGSWSEYSRK